MSALDCAISFSETDPIKSLISNLESENVSRVRSSLIEESRGYSSPKPLVGSESWFRDDIQRMGCGKGW